MKADPFVVFHGYTNLPVLFLIISKLSASKVEIVSLSVGLF